MLVILLTSMISGAFTSGFDWFYPLRVLAALAILGFGFRRYTELLRGSWSWSAVAIGVGAFAIWMALEPVHERLGLPEALRLPPPLRSPPGSRSVSSDRS